MKAAIIIALACMSSCVPAIETKEIEGRSNASEALAYLATQEPSIALMDVMTATGIEEPYIVYCQAVLETGNFTSYLCRQSHNLFGLYDSKRGEYMTFDNWVESVEAYRDYIQSKYTGGDYYEFLERIHYAEDSLYCRKLRILVDQYEQYD